MHTELGILEVEPQELVVIPRGVKFRVRLAEGAADDPRLLVPEYVSLPRGVAQPAGEIEWSRDHR